MSVIFPNGPLPTAVEVVTPAQGDILTQIVLPASVSGMAVSVYPSAAAYFTYAGADGAPAGSAVKLPLPAQQWTELDQLSASIWIGSATSSAKLTFALAVLR